MELNIDAAAYATKLVELKKFDHDKDELKAKNQGYAAIPFTWHTVVEDRVYSCSKHGWHSVA